MLVSERPGSYHSNLEMTPLYLLSANAFSPFTEVESWGPSLLISEFAKKNGLRYDVPDWELVKKFNSKQFSFEMSPKLPGSALLSYLSQAEQWLRSISGPKVLKSCYGVSGKGHLIIEEATPREKILRFLQLEWSKGLLVLAEPWVERLMDFSTQWVIHKNTQVEYLGSTLCTNDARGAYRYSTVGDEKVLFKEPFLNVHKEIAKPVLHQMAKAGYFCNVGIDAMLYLSDKKEPTLHPIVEINARKTMGWAALCFQRQHHPEDLVRFSFQLGSGGYLPESIIASTGKIFSFERNLFIDVLSKN